ncbi:MAG: hypothetical protein E6G39_09790 [Actinobacteria bacterium]|nr:MAG: hypothetical protein E6G39_09790 [Actinomycetota bacterium]
MSSALTRPSTPIPPLPSPAFQCCCFVGWRAVPSLFVDRPSPNQPSLDQPRVLFATVDLSPVARVGGLGEAAAGLTAALERAGIDVEIVLPDYDNRSLADETVEDLDVPEWVGAARARRGIDASGRAITVVTAPTIARPHPYLDPATGEGWIDNDHRFAAFCAGVAAITKTHRPEARRATFGSIVSGHGATRSNGSGQPIHWRVPSRSPIE